MMIRYMMVGILVLAGCKSTSDKRGKVTPPITQGTQGTQGAGDEDVLPDPAEDPGPELIIEVKKIRDQADMLTQIAADPKTPKVEQDKAKQSAETLAKIADQMENIAQHGTPAQKKRMCEAVQAGGALVGGDDALNEESSYAAIGWVVAGIALAGGTAAGAALLFPMSTKKMNSALTAAYGAGWRELGLTVQGVRKYGAVEYKAYLEAIDEVVDRAMDRVGGDAAAASRFRSDLMGIVRPNGSSTVDNILGNKVFQADLLHDIVTEKVAARRLGVGAILKIVSDANTSDPAELRKALEVGLGNGALLKGEREHSFANFFDAEKFEGEKFSKALMAKANVEVAKISDIQKNRVAEIKASTGTDLEALKKVQTYIGGPSWQKLKARAPSRKQLVAAGVVVSAAVVGYGIYDWATSDTEISSLSLTNSADDNDEATQIFRDAAVSIEETTAACAAS